MKIKTASNASLRAAFAANAPAKRAKTVKPEIEALCFTLPMPPSANRYWRSGRGRVYLSEEATRYKATVAREARDFDLKPLRGAGQRID